MRYLFIALAASVASASAVAQAPPASPQQLAKQHNCLACHAAATKLVGPSYQDVAAKYRDDPKAPEYLATKIKQGSSGVWGPVPMPPNAGLNDAEVKTLVDWILAGAPDK
ncbi:cytochrome C [Pigmentiphaga sp. NML080357]|uniref:c-type cytochrome n=1 Tax=Pigmentiphaga sp. NML080357 TaxID=2008675 RepID=UPI000B41EC7D|nr:c-type cytochrome [Pigmentiphaga sp. NML080357]OVZ60615.1 cytochrome C [Pigmentiphaga sp. NML080357]